MGSKVFGLGVLVIWGIVLADVLIHPQGTTAATNGVATVLKPTYNALLGGGR